MTDETTGDGGVATAGQAEESRLDLKVEVSSKGPCNRHVRVCVAEADIKKCRQQALMTISESASVPGFRPGHVPAELLSRRFRRELADQVRQQILMQSLEQLSEDKTLDPINEPDFDVESLDIPDSGDFEYEFDVEVRPEFELPNYRGLKLKREKVNNRDQRIDEMLEQFRDYRTRYESATDETIGLGSRIDAKFEFSSGGATFARLTQMVLVRPVLRFQDGEITGFDKLVTGAKVGDSRETTVKISTEATDPKYRGETLSVKLTITDHEKVVPTPIDDALAESYGYASLEELREVAASTIDRRIDVEHRRSVRGQVIAQITDSAKWELPEKLLRRQFENALRRDLLELEQSGYSQEEILSRSYEIRQRAMENTSQALKEHFVLDKIATKENIEVGPVDIESEIAQMALGQGETPRRVRARLEKSGMIDNLSAQIRERMAIDLIVENATFEEVDAPPAVDHDKYFAISRAICSEVEAESDAESEAASN